MKWDLHEQGMARAKPSSPSYGSYMNETFIALSQTTKGRGCQGNGLVAG
ncbi:hypothetical protein TNIN_45641, partial [Trichonephila inaurata madagascariensis]